MNETGLAQAGYGTPSGGTAAGDLGGRSIGGGTGTMTETNKATAAQP